MNKIARMIFIGIAFLLCACSPFAIQPTITPTPMPGVLEHSIHFVSYIASRDKFILEYWGVENDGAEHLLLLNNSPDKSYKLIGKTMTYKDGTEFSPSPTNSLIAFQPIRDYGTGEGALVLEDYQGNVHAALLPSDWAKWNIVWSPDGQTLAFRTFEGIKSESIYILNINQLRITKLANFPTDDGSYATMTWLDNQHLIYSKLDGKDEALFEIDMQGNQKLIHKVDGSNIGYAVVSTNGDELAYFIEANNGRTLDGVNTIPDLNDSKTYSGHYEIMNLTTGQITNIDQQINQGYFPAWGKDGTLVFADMPNGGNIYKYNGTVKLAIPFATQMDNFGLTTDNQIWFSNRVGIYVVDQQSGDILQLADPTDLSNSLEK